MIIINNEINILDKGLENEREVHYPSRKLTKEEKETITSSIFDGINWVYYQGDEPPKKEIEEIKSIIEEEKVPKIDLKSILLNATSEEIQFIKDLLK